MSWNPSNGSRKEVVKFIIQSLAKIEKLVLIIRRKRISKFFKLVTLKDCEAVQPVTGKNREILQSIAWKNTKFIDQLQENILKFTLSIKGKISEIVLIRNLSISWWGENAKFVSQLQKKKKKYKIHPLLTGKSNKILPIKEDSIQTSSNYDFWTGCKSVL